MPNKSEQPEERADLEKDFEELFERYYRPVTVFFANRGYSEEESRDLAQETFLGAYRGFDSFRGDSTRKTWLFRIAKNVSINTRRGQATGKRKADLVSLDAEDDGPSLYASTSVTVGKTFAGPEEEFLHRDLTERLQEAIKELPPQMRRCFTLRYDQGRKYKEIATVLGIKIDTVKSQLFQARARLTETLAGSGREPQTDKPRESS